VVAVERWLLEEVRFIVLSHVNFVVNLRLFQNLSSDGPVVLALK